MLSSLEVNELFLVLFVSFFGSGLFPLFRRYVSIYYHTYYLYLSRIAENCLDLNKANSNSYTYMYQLNHIKL